MATCKCSAKHIAFSIEAIKNCDLTPCEIVADVMRFTAIKDDCTMRFGDDGAGINLP